MLDAAGHDPDFGDLHGVFPDRADVGLFLRPARGGGRMVGVGALHGHPELAAFLARRRLGHGQKHVPMGLRRQGVRVSGLLRGRGAGGRHGAV